MKPEETFKTRQNLETVNALRKYLVSAHTIAETLTRISPQRNGYAIVYKLDEALLWSRKYQEELEDKLSKVEKEAT